MVQLKIMNQKLKMKTRDVQAATDSAFEF